MHQQVYSVNYFDRKKVFVQIELNPLPTFSFVAQMVVASYDEQVALSSPKPLKLPSNDPFRRPLKYEALRSFEYI